MKKKAIFDKKNVLVLGGAGFIGSHLCDALVREAKVICVDNFLTGDERNIDHLLANHDFEFVKHDITEPLDLENMPELQKFKIEFQGIQEIYNLACPMSTKNFEQNKISTLLANSVGVKNALDLARNYEAKLLHFSSSVVYGFRAQDNHSVAEEEVGMTDHLSVRSSYDEGKKFAETMIVNYRDEYKIDAKIVRFFRIYGPRMPLGDGQLIADFIDSSLANKDLVIYGDDKFSSTYLYVADAVEVSMKFMDSDQVGPLNVGSDYDVNLTKIAKMITELTGSKSRITYEPAHTFFTQLAIPDINKAKTALNWMPITTLEKGLKLTIEDFQVNKNLKKFSANF